jgi:single-stranded-DNA-specific exonuclease
LLRALAKHHLGDQDSLKTIMRYFLPVVAIGTVADCVPLIHENRLFVKLGLEYLNSKQGVPQSLLNFVEYLKITDPVDTFHIGFLIGPRINAGGRIVSPYESLYTLLYSGEKQLQYLQSIDMINTERKKLQEKAYTIAEQQIDREALVSIAMSEEFHEGIVGIVAGRLSEKYYKPSVVLSIKQEEGIAV